MRKIICDRCDAEIPNNQKIGYISANWRRPSDWELLHDNPYEHMDFCEHCMNVIVACIDNVDISREEPEAVEDPVQEEPEEPVVQVQKAAVRKIVDKGKVGALSKAGWSNTKIADEMGVSSERIRQILKELEAQK